MDTSIQATDTPTDEAATEASFNPKLAAREYALLYRAHARHENAKAERFMKRMTMETWFKRLNLERFL